MFGAVYTHLLCKLTRGKLPETSKLLHVVLEIMATFSMSWKTLAILSWCPSASSQSLFKTQIHVSRVDLPWSLATPANAVSRSGDLLGLSWDASSISTFLTISALHYRADDYMRRILKIPSHPVSQTVNLIRRTRSQAVKGVCG
jgi:hypothetical protein